MKTTYSTTPVAFSFPIPELDFRDCSANRWNGGSIVRSHFWNCMSSLLPNIEFCAIRSLMPLVKLIDEPKLHAEVKLFCDQEAAHGTTHSRFNSQHLHTRYPFLLKIENWERKLFSLMAAVFPRKLFLSLFVAVEHWTAAFSQYGLAEPDAWFCNSDSTMFTLWEWHAVEELAHKSVCYDVYRFFKGGFFIQVIGMLILLLLIMLPGIVLRLMYVFAKDGVSRRLSTYVELCKYLFGRQGVLRKTFGDFLSFFNPRYRPWNIDSKPLIEAYLSRLDGEHVTLPTSCHGFD